MKIEMKYCSIAAVIAVAALLIFSGIYFSQVSASYSSGAKSQSQYFSANGTFTVPSGVTLVWVTAWGGGGSGGVNSGDGGGGGGEVIFRKPITTVPADTFGVVVGAGGITGKPGGNTTFNTSASSPFTVVYAQGGKPGVGTTGGAGGGWYNGTGGANTVAGAKGTTFGYIIGGSGGGGGTAKGADFGEFQGGAGVPAGTGGGGASFNGTGSSGGVNAAANSGAGGSGAGGGAGSGGLIVEWIS